MSIHLIGIIGLVVVFVIGTLRPINIGVLALVMTYLIGTWVVGQDKLMPAASSFAVTASLA